MMNLKDEVTLGKLSLLNRVLFSGFLLVIGLGFCASGAQILMTHGMADGELGLTHKDIVYSYYGNRNGSRLENALNGKMKLKAPPEVNAVLIEWAHKGAPESEWNTIAPLINAHCSKCHADDESDLPRIEKLDIAKSMVKVDEGASISTLTRVSHIHLFGIAFIFLYVGWIFSMAEFNHTLKVILIGSPFLFLILDVLSWWLTKYCPHFAVAIIISGFGYAIAAFIMLTEVLASPPIALPELKSVQVTPLSELVLSLMPVPFW